MRREPMQMVDIEAACDRVNEAISSLQTSRNPVVTVLAVGLALRKCGFDHVQGHPQPREGCVFSVYCWNDDWQNESMIRVSGYPDEAENGWHMLCEALVKQPEGVTVH